MIISLFQIDAFADKLFEGNPASVCVLKKDFLPEVIMQRIAAENNHSETAFIYPDTTPFWKIRWFTPTREVPLCGHATLAAAFVVFEYIVKGGELVVFETQSAGRITVRKRSGGMLEMDMPCNPPSPLSKDAFPAEALGGPAPEALFRSGDCALAIYESERQVRALKPDFKALEAVADFTMFVATAPGFDCDFVSRTFAPKAGIDEDPVTGFAHTILTPLWAKRLDKDFLAARQVSTRGGKLFCELRGQRVAVAGQAVRYSEGFIEF
jgi:PhzF family phenazine biosynthesis protein